MVATHSPLDLVLSRLRLVKPGRNGNWMAQCPAHNDPVPSLSITTGRDNRVLLNCFAGCDPHEIVARLDLVWTDLFPDDSARPKQDGPIDLGAETGRTKWVIRDYDGTPVMVHHRIDYEDGKKIWWSQPDGSRGMGDRRLEDVPLYGSHETDYEGGKALFVVEGEKARDALAGAIDVTVLATFGADHMPGLDVLLPLLRWQTLYLWPDRDRGGLQHMRALAEALTTLGHDAVRIIIDPDAEWKDDAADWIARGGTRADLARLCTEAMSAAEFLDTAVAGVGDIKQLATPRDTRVYSLNGVDYQVQYLDTRRGMEASIIALTKDRPEPLAADRISLDRQQQRQQFAKTAGVDEHDLLVLRSLLIDAHEHPGGHVGITANEEWADRALDYLYTDTSTFIKTGFRCLDSEIIGFERQQLIVTSAPTGGGKTSFLVGTLLNNLMRRIRCGMISLEMTGEEIYARLSSALSQQSFSVVRNSDSKISEHEEKVHQAIATLRQKPLYLSDEVPATLPAVIDYARKLKDEADIEMLVIDQIHSIKTTGNETRNELVGMIANSFKQLARELNVPVLTAAQMNRQQTFRKEKMPIIDDIRDSAEIGHQADMVLFVHHPYHFDPESEPENVMQFVVAKNRNGKANFSARIGWHPATASFRAL